MILEVEKMREEEVVGHARRVHFGKYLGKITFNSSWLYLFVCLDMYCISPVVFALFVLLSCYHLPVHQSYPFYCSVMFLFQATIPTSSSRTTPAIPSCGSTFVMVYAAALNASVLPGLLLCDHPLYWIRIPSRSVGRIFWQGEGKGCTARRFGGRCLGRDCCVGSHFGNCEHQ